MPNMKALSHTIKKLWPMLKFLKSRSKVKIKVTNVQYLWFRRKGLVIRYKHAKYESRISMIKVMANVKVFSKEGQRSRSRSQVQNLWYCWKGLDIRTTHAKYERLISKSKTVMANVKVF